MRHQKRGRKFNRTASHRRAMMSNLASALILHKRIQTTDAKGKELRGFVERLVTYAKKGDVHGRRLIQKKIQGKITRGPRGLKGRETVAIVSNEKKEYPKVLFRNICFVENLSSCKVFLPTYEKAIKTMK